MKYIKGDYVVLLTTCDGNPTVWKGQLPINYVYKLREDFDWYCFLPEKDIRRFEDNGWTISNSEEGKIECGKMTVRAATPYEIEDYIRAGKPVKANQIRAYEIY